MLQASKPGGRTGHSVYFNSNTMTTMSAESSARLARTESDALEGLEIYLGSVILMSWGKLPGVGAHL